MGKHDEGGMSIHIQIKGESKKIKSLSESMRQILFISLVFCSSFASAASLSKIVSLVNAGNYSLAAPLLYKQFQKDSTDAGIAYVYANYYFAADNPRHN